MIDRDGDSDDKILEKWFVVLRGYICFDVWG